MSNPAAGGSGPEVNIQLNEIVQVKVNVNDVVSNVKD